MKMRRLSGKASTTTMLSKERLKSTHTGTIWTNRQYSEQNNKLCRCNLNIVNRTELLSNIETCATYMALWCTELLIVEFSSETTWQDGHLFWLEASTLEARSMVLIGQATTQQIIQKCRVRFTHYCPLVCLECFLVVQTSQDTKECLRKTCIFRCTN